MKKNEIVKILKNERLYLHKTFGIKRIAIFGSFARGEQHRDSDVDIFVELERPIGFKFIELCEHLEKKLGRKADVLTPGGMAGIRLKSIARDIKRNMVYV